MASRQALLQYIEITNTKLSVADSKYSSAELKTKIMPSVVESIRRLCAGAPPTMKHHLEKLFIENAVLPDFDADIEAFKHSLRSIYKCINSTLEHSQCQTTSSEPQNAIAQSKKMPQNEEQASARAAPEEAQTAGYQPEETQVAKHTLSQMPVKQLSEVSHQTNTCNAKPLLRKAVPREGLIKKQITSSDLQNSSLQSKQDSPQKQEVEQMPAMRSAEAAQKEGDQNEVTQLIASHKQTKAFIRCERDAGHIEDTFGPKASQSKGADTARCQLLNYIDSTLSRLEASSDIGGTQLKTKVLPSVISSIERLSAAAPLEIKRGIKDVLQKSGVVPIWAADLESLKSALLGIKGFIADALQGMARAPREIQNSLGHPLRGISVAYLSTKFLDEMQAHGLDRSAKVYEVEPAVIRGKGRDVICPRDGKAGAAYIDCLGESDAGMSTHMLSYTWGYEVGDIVDSLLAFCNNQKLDPQKVFVWICCLCINQHRVIEARESGDVVPFEQFKDAFGHRVRSIGHIVAMMSPWKDPSYTKRVWCDFEMYTAASLGEDVCKISVTMPPRESDDMRMTLMSGGANNHELWQALQNVKIEEAQASVQEDKDRILKLIEESIGFHALNSTVTKCLQSWVATTCQEIFDELPKDSLRSEEEIAKTAASVGYVLRDVGKMEKALGVLSEARDLFTEAGILKTHDGAILLSNLGATNRRCGELEHGLDLLHQAQEVFEYAGTLETLAGAMMYNSLGAAKRQACDIAGAVDAYEAACTILKDIGELETSEGASVMNSYGALKRQIGDYDGALHAFHVAEGILETKGEIYSPSGYMLMNSIAAAKKSRKDIRGALEAYERGRHIVERMGTLESENGVSLLINVGISRRKVKNLPGALEALTAARDICKKMNTLHTPEGSQLLDTLADLEAQMNGKGKGNGKGSHKGNNEGGKAGQGKGQGKGHKGKGSTGRRMSDPGFGHYANEDKLTTETGQFRKGNKGKGKGKCITDPKADTMKSSILGQGKCITDPKADTVKSSILGQATPLRKARTESLGNSTEVVNILP